jgi:hypothetical protein
LPKLNDPVKGVKFMDKPTYGVVLLHSTSAAIRAEKLTKGAGLKVKLIPVPRQLSSDCGISLRFEWDRADEVRSVLETKGVEIQGIHQIE